MRMTEQNAEYEYVRWSEGSHRAASTGIQLLRASDRYARMETLKIIRFRIIIITSTQ